MTDAARLLEAWRRDLESWAIPREILDQAAAAPWATERALFVRRATERMRAPRGISYARAHDALPEGGSLLDIGAGAGAASLPLIARAAAIVAVDQDRELLASLVAQAGPDAHKVRTVEGAWPAVAAETPVTDVVVCHHVLYNVPDLRPFIEAIVAHARRRVVIEITASHPVARLYPLWQHFHGLARPTGPTWEDAAAAIGSLIGPLHGERERVPADGATGGWDELVAFTARRLCLGPERQPEVAAALTELLGARLDEPATWSPPIREVATIWWDVPAAGVTPNGSRA